MQTHTFVKTTRFTPGAVGTAETTSVMRIKKGYRLKRASFKVLINTDASATPTVSLGDSVSVTGVSAATTVTAAANVAGTLVNGGNLAGNGKLYNADDNLKVDYVVGATPGATRPSIMVFAEFSSEWPE